RFSGAVCQDHVIAYAGADAIGESPRGFVSATNGELDLAGQRRRSFKPSDEKLESSRCRNPAFGFELLYGRRGVSESLAGHKKHAAAPKCVEEKLKSEQCCDGQITVNARVAREARTADRHVSRNANSEQAMRQPDGLCGASGAGCEGD